MYKRQVYLSTAYGDKILDAGGDLIFSTCLSKTILNALDRCCPIYRIVGKGVCSFSVNGNWMHATVDGEIIIDTEREVAYKPDGEKASRKITGDYEQLRLVSGKNELMTGSAFDFYITPIWRSELYRFMKRETRIMKKMVMRFYTQYPVK